MMAMMDVAYMLPTGGLTAQADWLGPKVGGHLALLLHSSHAPFVRALVIGFLCYGALEIVGVIIIIIIICQNS